MVHFRGNFYMTVHTFYGRIFTRFIVESQRLFMLKLSHFSVANSVILHTLYLLNFTTFRLYSAWPTKRTIPKPGTTAIQLNQRPKVDEQPSSPHGPIQNQSPDVEGQRKWTTTRTTEGGNGEPEQTSQTQLLAMAATPASNVEK